LKVGITDMDIAIKVRFFLANLDYLYRYEQVIAIGDNDRSLGRRERVINEVMMMKGLHHPNIIKVWQTFFSI